MAGKLLADSLGLVLHGLQYTFLEEQDFEDLH